MKHVLRVDDAVTRDGGATSALTLVSHRLCPYVQRAAIVLLEKQAPFERRWIDLASKPDWFVRVSPLGKTPVLLVGDVPVFESAVICEYLDEVLEPRLHPEEPLARARARSWMEVGSALLGTISAFYSAPDDGAVATHRAVLRSRFETVEHALATAGPWFAGERFSMVDAVFAPVFRYFDAFEALGDRAVLHSLPRVAAWRAALAGRASIREAVPREYPVELATFLAGRDSAIGRLARLAAAGPGPEERRRESA